MANSVERAKLSATRPAPAGAGPYDRIAAFVLYQSAWFACAFAARAGFPLAGAAAAAGGALIHLSFARDRREEALLAGIAALWGIGSGAIHLSLGTLAPPAAAPEHGAFLVWLVALWLQLGTTIRPLFTWLERRPVLAAAVGALGGPLAFLGGERMGALRLGANRPLALALLAVEWAIAFPLLRGIADRLPGRFAYRSPIRRAEEVSPTN